MDRVALAQSIAQHPALASARKALGAYRSRVGPMPEEVLLGLSNTKKQAVEKNDQVLAGAAWCLETIGAAQDAYVTGFRNCQERCFYDGWVVFEKGEVQLSFLGRHFEDERDEFGVQFMRDHLPRFQSLFPYQFFLSPGFLKLEVRCSICDAIVTPRRSCGHRRFELYDGRMCGRRVTKFRALEVALVEQPVQKYSVVFPEDRRYDYSVVHYAVTALRSPWDSWRVEVQKRRQIEPQYSDLRPNDLCRCGSGQKFKRCCKSKSVREVMHHQFDFDVRPFSSFPTFFQGEKVHDQREPFQVAAGINAPMNVGAEVFEKGASPQLLLQANLAKKDGFDG